MATQQRIVAERFIETLKSKIYEQLTGVSKNMYINKVDEIFDKDDKTDLEL